MDNPYQSFLDLMEFWQQKQKGPPLWRFGAVARENPLAVDFGGTWQEGESLLLSASLGSLEVGDRVVALSDGDQQFILLCRVVSA